MKRYYNPRFDRPELQRRPDDSLDYLEGLLPWFFIRPEKYESEPAREASLLFEATLAVELLRTSLSILKRIVAKEKLRKKYPKTSELIKLFETICAELPALLQARQYKKFCLETERIMFIQIALLMRAHEDPEWFNEVAEVARDCDLPGNDCKWVAEAITTGPGQGFRDWETDVDPLASVRETAICIKRDHAEDGLDKQAYYLEDLSAMKIGQAMFRMHQQSQPIIDFEEFARRLQLNAKQQMVFRGEIHERDAPTAARTLRRKMARWLIRHAEEIAAARATGCLPAEIAWICKFGFVGTALIGNGSIAIYADRRPAADGQAAMTYQFKDLELN